MPESGKSEGEKKHDRCKRNYMGRKGQEKDLMLSGMVGENIIEKVTLEQRLRVDERPSCAEVWKGTDIVECVLVLI